MAKVTNGRVFRVENKSRKFGANSHYNFVFLEDSNGDNETPYMFTDSQIKRARSRAEKNTEDIMKKSAWANMLD